jgi:hypothetical protein
MQDTVKQKQFRQLPLSQALMLKEASLTALVFTRLEPINDAVQREFRDQHAGKKLLTIIGMFLLMGYLVWSMG